MIVVTSPMEHIQNSIDEPPIPFKGRNPQRGGLKRGKRGNPREDIIVSQPGI